MAGAGETLMLGIAVELDASGVVRGVSLAEEQLERLERRSRNSGRNAMQDLQNQLSAGSQAAGSAMMVGLGAVGAGEAMRRMVLNPMLQNAEEFEVEFSRLGFVSGAMGDELEAMRALALRTGVETQFSPTQAMSGLRRLRAAGLETQESIHALRSSLDLATASAGMLGLDRATLSTAAAIAQFRHQFDTANERMNASKTIMDNWAQTTRETALSMEDLPVIMRSLRGMPNVWEANANEVFGLAGMLRSAGLSAADSAQAVSGLGRRFAILSRSMARWQRMQERGSRRMMPEAVRAFKRFGVEIFDSEGKIRGMTTVVGELIDAYRRFGSDEDRIRDLNTLLGMQAAQVVSAGASFRRFGMEGSGAMAEMIRRIGDSEGAMRAGAAAFENTLQGMKIFVVGSMQTIAVVLGELLAPVIKTVVTLAKEMANGFLAFINAYPNVARGIAIFILGFTVLTIAGGTLIVVVSGLAIGLLTLVSAFAALSVAGVTLTGVIAALEMVMWPLLVVTALLAAQFIAFIIVISAFTYAYQTNLGGLKDFIDDWVGDIKLIWNSLVDWFKNDQNSISATLKEKLEERGLDQTFLRIAGFVVRLQLAFKRAKEIIVPVGEVIFSVFDMVLKGIIWVVDGIEDLLAGLGVKFDENTSKWETAGQIIGIVFAGLLVVASIAVLGLTIALSTLAAVLLLLTLPLIIGIALLGLFIYGIISFATEVSNKLAPIKTAFYDVQVAIYQAFLPLIIFFERIQQYIFSFQEYLSELADNIIMAMLPVIIFFERVGITIYEFFANLISRVGEAGSALVESFKAGIESQWSNFVGWFSSKLSAISSFLPQSDAEAGPLSALTDSGRSLVTTFQTGMDSAFPQLLTGFQEGLGGIASMLGIGEEGETGRIGGMSPAGVVETAVGGTTPATASPIGGRNISVRIGDINISVQQASPEEAERLASMIIDRINNAVNEETEVTFS